MSPRVAVVIGLVASAAVAQSASQVLPPGVQAVPKPDDRLTTLLELAPAGRKVTVFDRACHPLTLERVENSLMGLAHSTTTVSGGTKEVHTEDVVLDRDVTLRCGSDQRFERRGQKWELVSSGGTGCFQSIGQHLSKITATAIWYAGEPVQVTVSGGSSDAGCEQLSVTVRGEHETTMRSLNGNCVKAAQFAGVEFERVDPSADPLLFKTLAACREYRAAHPRMAAPLW